MGQQQLLLVILVTILVGIATVVAINVFGDSAEQANRDAVRQDLLQAAAQAQAVWVKPALLGGADRNFANPNITEAELLAALRIPGNSATRTNLDDDSVTDDVVTNENGVYRITASGEDNITIFAEPTSYTRTIELALTRENNEWTFDITEADFD